MLFRNNQDVYQSSLLADISWLEHGFGTRHTSDWPDPSTMASLKQVHSDHVCRIRDEVGIAGRGDALMTDRRGRMLSIRTADCQPLLIADIDRRVVGCVHAGWRGSALRIAAKSVQRMSWEFGTRPESLRVAIGPGIRGCCYEVGPEVATQFTSVFPERHDLDRRTELDLAEANRRQLIEAGVPAECIDIANVCTFCLGAEFHSYRRDRDRAGRMVSAIGIR